MAKREQRAARTKLLCRVHDDVNERVECEAKPLQRLVRLDPIQAHDLKQARMTHVVDGQQEAAIP